MNPMGKLKNELLLRMGSMGPSRLGLRVQEKGMCVSFSKTNPYSSFMHSTDI